MVKAMIDISAYIKALNTPDHVIPPAKMSGGDLPKWNMDYDYWIGDSLWMDRDRLNNPTYRCSDDGEAISGEIDT